LQEVDPKGVFEMTEVARAPLPGIYKAMKNFIDPPKSSPTKASSSSQPSLLENSQSAGSEGQGQANIVESQDESVLNDPANTDWDSDRLCTLAFSMSIHSQDLL